MSQSLIITLKLPLNGLEGSSDEELELVQRLYLAGLPPTFRRVATCQVVDDAAPSYAERMMECVRAERRKYDNRNIYRPRKSYYIRGTGEQ